MATHRDRFPDYSECIVREFKDNPTRMEWDIKFKGSVPPETKQNVKGLIFEAFPRVQQGDALGVVVGDILFFYDDYPTTRLQISRELLNFTRTPDFNNPDSFIFKQQSDLLCEDVSNRHIGVFIYKILFAAVIISS